MSILKWSGGLFPQIKSNKPIQEDYSNIYQKKFGHADLHREFAINYWLGKIDEYKICLVDIT